MNEFYVYIYLDPRKKGKYHYPNLQISFLYEPFYIGKGKFNRITDHLRCLNNKKLYDNYFYKKFRKIYNDTNDIPPSIKLYENISENESFEKEKTLIKIIGRKDLNKGPLCNLTDGGEGGSGHILSEESRIKRSNSLKGEKSYWFGKTPSEEIRMKISQSNKGKIRTDEFKQNLSESRKGNKSIRYGKPGTFLGKKHTEESKIKMSESKLGENHPNFGKSSAMSGRKHSHISKIKMSESKLGNNNNFYGKTHSIDSKKKISETMKQIWQIRKIKKLECENEN